MNISLINDYFVVNQSLVLWVSYVTFYNDENAMYNNCGV